MAENFTAKYIMEAAHARDEYARHALALATVIRAFLKGKRGNQYLALRIQLAAYDREITNRPTPEPTPEPDPGWH